MPTDCRIQQYEAALGGWHICEQIGEGSAGKTRVYRIEKHNSGWTEKNALKAINIADEHGIFTQLTESEKLAYQSELTRRRKKAETELQTMYALRGLPTIASFLEHKFVDWQEDTQFGCDLLIQMELMQCLRGRDGQLTVGPEQALQVGKDVCEALIECHKRSIIHRDIKPGNIFKDRHGRYRLGDFGISRTVSDSRFASTGICTEAYAAPEQLNGGKYTELVDIYSLGLTLYELCNDGRLPFAESRYANQSSIEKRLSEKRIPPPCCASPELSAVILKACAYDPRERYQSAEAMLVALDPYATRPAGYRAAPKRSRFGMIVALIVLALCLGAAGWFGLTYLRNQGKITDNAPLTDQAHMGITEIAHTNTEPDSTAPEPENHSQTPAELTNTEQTANSTDEETTPKPIEQEPQEAQDLQSESRPVLVASVSLSENSLSMNNGGTATLSASVSPSNADDRTVTWKSSDSSVVTVSNGKLSAVGDGTAVITASAGGKNAKCTVTVQTVWSEWMDSLPAGVSSKTETQVLYRYTDYRKDTVESYSPTIPSGYKWEGSTTEEGYEPEEVVDVEGHYEYRYGCWVGANGKHSYCNVMAIKYYGAPASIQYTDWSTTQFVNTGTKWTCGSGDTGKHMHDGTGGWLASNTGNHVWYLYSQSGSTKTESGYFWEEEKWVDTTYKTEYKPVTKTLFHYYRMVSEYESSWSTDKPAEQENRTIEQKTQYRYMITD